MKLSERIKPISYLRAHTAKIIRDLCTHHGMMVITQHGRGKAVVQDITTYEQTQESLIGHLQQLGLDGRDKHVRRR